MNHAFALTIFFTLIFPSSGISQDLSCEEVMEFIQEEGHLQGSVGSLALLDSEWLSHVEAYSYDGNYYVIAKIKRNEFDFYPKSYVFCGVPMSNWNSFKNPFYKSDSYGERFHKYIIDYKCNCY